MEIESSFELIVRVAELQRLKRLFADKHYFFRTMKCLQYRDEPRDIFCEFA